MAWFSRKAPSTASSAATAVTVPPKPPSPSRPAPQPVTAVPLEDNELKAYKRTCDAICFYPAALLHAELLAFFKEEGIPTYPYPEVCGYLQTKALQQNRVWCWRPLRQEDTAKIQSISGYEFAGNRHGHYYPANSECGPYTAAVPLRVLGIVEKIHERFGDKVAFFVSDYAVPHPDPVIMVAVVGVPVIVFDVWDEPDFGVKPEDV